MKPFTEFYDEDGNVECTAVEYAVIINMLEDARRMCTNTLNRSREVSLAKTKIEEAILWLKSPIIDDIQTLRDMGVLDD